MSEETGALIPGCSLKYLIIIWPQLFWDTQILPPKSSPSVGSDGVMRVWKRDLKEDETVATAHVDPVCRR